MTAQWVKYDGSDKQIAALSNAKHGWVVKYEDGVISKFISFGEPMDMECPMEYLICDPHPYADMICQQARTGRPVWVRMKSSTYWIIAMRGFDLIYQDHVVSVIKSNTPDWNIPGAEYSFTEFEEEV